MGRSAWLSAAMAFGLLAALGGCGEKLKAVSGDWRSGIKEVRMAVSGSNDDPRLVKQRSTYQARLSY